MNDRIRRYPLRFALFVVCGSTLTMVLAMPVLSRSVTPQQVTAFLSAPYYGATWVSSVFDHDVRDRYILALTGVTADMDSCPCIAPQPCQHPTFPSAYYSCAINDYLYYNAHNGIDYVLRYDYVRAAAPGTVARANWADPNYQVSYGLHVRIDHDVNGDHNTDYQTIYGHMSVLRVQMGDEIPANTDEFARIIGISGNTGGSSGPHLHFEVRNAAGVAVDPYGPDRNPDHKLWIELPSIDPHVIYTSGDYSLAVPPIVEDEPGYITIDDGDTGFIENPAGCGWSNVDRASVLSPAGWQTIASQSFDGVFPGEWVVFDNDGSTGGEYYWNDRTCRPYAGNYSGWGVGGGAQGAALSCGSDYPHNISSWMVYGPFDLEDAIAGELAFKLWLYTELENDYVFRGASVNGVNFYGYATSGNTQGWVDKNLDLANMPTLGNLLGESQVWVALIFSSNNSMNYTEGGYVDNVLLRECLRGPCPSGNDLSFASEDDRIVEIPMTVTRNR